VDADQALFGLEQPFSQVNPDFKELLLAFNEHNVEYLIVGTHALAAHAHVRATN
jgi:hypothetical protein